MILDRLLGRAPAAAAAEPGAASPQALARARRLATPYVRAIAAAERAAPAARLGYDGAELGRVFQLLSPETPSAAAATAAQMAWAARAVLVRRTLLLSHQSVDSRARQCERASARRGSDVRAFPRLRLPNDLAPAALDRVLDRARARYELTFLAARSVFTDPEALKCAPLVDGVILVITAETTTSTRAREAMRIVADAGGRPLGFVMTNRRECVPVWAGGRPVAA